MSGFGPPPAPPPPPGSHCVCPVTSLSRCDVSNRRGEAGAGLRSEGEARTGRRGHTQARAGQLVRLWGICVMVYNGGQDVITPCNDIRTPGVIVSYVEILPGLWGDTLSWATRIMLIRVGVIVIHQMYPLSLLTDTSVLHSLCSVQASLMALLSSPLWPLTSSAPLTPTATYQHN